MDKQEYIQSLRDKLKAQIEKNEKGFADFRKAVTESDLKAALKDLPYLTEEGDVAKAMDIIRDKNADASLRALALLKVSNAKVNDPDFIETNIRLLEDPNNDEKVRLTSFNLLSNLSFSSKQMAASKAAFVSTLRKVVEDPVVSLREMATEVLAVNKDESIQQRLVDDIKANRSTLVPRLKAIQLLRYDIHGNHYPVVKDILLSRDATEPEKVAAVHVLANDPSAKDLLVDILKDKQQLKKVRVATVSALQAINPEAFVSAAKQIVLDDKEDKSLRAVTLNGIMLHADSDMMKGDTDFIKHVDKIKAQSLSPALKKVARNYMEKVDKGKKKDNKHKQ